MSMGRTFSMCIALLLALVTSGCPAGKSASGHSAPEADETDQTDQTDSAEEPSNSSAASGEVPSEWSQYCVATFTQDTDVLDIFGDVQLSAKTGEHYLLLSNGDDFQPNQVTLGYWTADGPYPIDLVKADEAASFPFTSNCTLDTATRYYAVYADVDLYQDAELTQLQCSLPAGTIVRLDLGQPSGFAIAGSLDLFGPSTYQIQLNALSPLCGGAESGYALVQQTEVLDTTTAIIPIGPVLGP